MGWLNRIFNKKKRMDLKEKTLTEIKEELSKFDFQWIKGDKMGNIENFDSVVKEESTGMVFLQFAGSGRINIDLLDEYLDRFPASNVRFENQPPLEIIQNDLSQPNNQTFSAEPNKNHSSKKVVSSVELEESPIHKLLKKQKENWVSVNISLNLNLPPKNLYNVLVGSFNDADKEIIDYITDGINIDDIKSALADSVINYYDSTRKPTSQKLTKNKEENKILSEDGE